MRFLRRWGVPWVLAILCQALPAHGQTAGTASDFLGRVVGVPEGDRLVVMREGRPVSYRLYGIEAPSGDRGRQATLYLKQLAEARSVHVMPRGRNRHGHRVAGIEFIGGRNLSEELLRAGLARWDRQLAPRDWKLKYLEQRAQAARAGLWADPPSKPASKRASKKRASPKKPS